MPTGMNMKSRFSMGDSGEKKKLNYSSLTKAVVKNGAMIKHNLDQTTTLFHILSHFQSRAD